MIKDDSIYIDHIYQSLQKITTYTKGLGKDEFLENTMAQDAVIRQFEIIGEATKRISKAFRAKNPHLPWKDMAGMRDKLIHDYIDVDIWIVYHTAKQDVPLLLEEIGKILKGKV